MGPYMLVLLAVLGVVLMYQAETRGCTCSVRWEETLALGVVPWSVVGFAGYVAIAIASFFHYGTTAALVAAALAVTIWLAVKAHRIGLSCPYCRTAWAVNAVMAIVVYRFHW